MKIMNEDKEFLDRLWMSDEAHFHLTGNANKQNYRFWVDSWVFLDTIHMPWHVDFKIYRSDGMSVFLMF